jgi:TRAP-type C4-dicarboxylate transport system substrate-binding protein
MNTKKYNSLPKEIRKILHDVAAVYEVRVNKANSDKDKTVVKLRQKAGATILPISEEVRQQWAKYLSKVPNDAADEGDKLGLPVRKALKMYINILKKDGNKKMDAYNLN